MPGHPGRRSLRGPGPCPIRLLRDRGLVLGRTFIRISDRGDATTSHRIEYRGGRTNETRRFGALVAGKRVEEAEVGLVHGNTDQVLNGALPAGAFSRAGFS